MLPFSQPSCCFKTRLPSCALGTSFYTVSEGCVLITYVSDNYTSYSAPSPLKLFEGMHTNTVQKMRNSIYMDDVVAGASDVHEAFEFFFKIQGYF